MRSLFGNQVLCEALAQEMETNDRVFVLGEDIASLGGIFRVTEGLLARFGPKRVMNMPISEAGMVGMAVGAAMMGMRPVVEIMFADLFTVCMDQIVNTAAKTRYVTNGLLHAPIVLRTVNIGKCTVYVSQALEAWLAHVPGLKVVMPSKPEDAGGLLLTAIRDPDPVIFIENCSLYATSGTVPEQIEAIPFGQAKIRCQGTDVTVVAWANMVALAEEVGEKMTNEGISVEVIDLRTLVPFDKDTVVQSVSKTGRLVILQEAVRCCGFGAEVAAAVIDSGAFDNLRAPIVRVANPGVPVPFSRALHKLALPSADDATAAIRRVMMYV